MNWVSCDLYSGVRLKRLGDGWAVENEEEEEIKEGYLVQGCHHLGGRGEGNGVGVGAENAMRASILDLLSLGHLKAGDPCSQPQEGKLGCFSYPRGPD